MIVKGCMIFERTLLSRKKSHNQWSCAISKIFYCVAWDENNYLINIKEFTVYNFRNNRSHRHLLLTFHHISLINNQILPISTIKMHFLFWIFSRLFCASLLSRKKTRSQSHLLLSFKVVPYSVYQRSCQYLRWRCTCTFSSDF